MNEYDHDDAIHRMADALELIANELALIRSDRAEDNTIQNCVDVDAVKLSLLYGRTAAKLTTEEELRGHVTTTR